MSSGEIETLDTSDVDRYVGQIIRGGQLKEPVTVNEIRRWVQAMDYDNPRHYEETAAERTPFKGIVAPQSFTINCDAGNGTIPAIVGKIPRSHVVFGGDEWWFYGPRIRPGDKVRVERRFDGYSVAETKFAGPTMFSRGDTLYINQRQEPIAKQRTTIVRYLVDAAKKRDYYEKITPEMPSYTTEQLRGFVDKRRAWLKSGASGAGPGEVKVGDKLTTRALGPSTVASFTTENRALQYTVWGNQVVEEGSLGIDFGWIPELSGGVDANDVSMNMGLDEGPASGHTNPEKGKLIGMPRRYGYGSSMGVWVLDYVAYWAGDGGFVRHAKIDYRSPVFEGDVTFLDGEVTEVRFDPLLGVKLAVLRISMSNQNNLVIAKGPVEVELSRL